MQAHVNKINIEVGATMKTLLYNRKELIKLVFIDICVYNIVQFLQANGGCSLKYWKVYYYYILVEFWVLELSDCMDPETKSSPSSR